MTRSPVGSKLGTPLVACPGMLALIGKSLVIAFVCASVTLGAAGAAIASPFITTHGVGALRLGATVKKLHRKHLIGGLRPGCPFVTGQRAAPLRAPLRGWALFPPRSRRLAGITVVHGAETRQHIRIGSSAGEARKAYPGAYYEAPGTADPFAEGFLWVPDLSRPKLTFVVDPESRLVEAISVPSPSFCE